MVEVEGREGGTPIRKTEHMTKRQRNFITSTPNFFPTSEPVTVTCVCCVCPSFLFRVTLLLSLQPSPVSQYKWISQCLHFCLTDIERARDPTTKPFLESRIMTRYIFPFSSE